MNLNKLSDDELLLKTKSLAARERETLLEILKHLKEIDRRKLFLSRGYPSLWAYCTQELQYSEASAQRRIEAMRALREIPALEEKIESGSLSLSNIAKAQSMMRRAQSAGRKSQSNNLNEGVTRSPKNLTADLKLDLFMELENKSQKQAEVILASHFPEEVKSVESVRAITGEVSEIKLEVPRDLLAKIERVKSLFSHKISNPTFAQTLELMADFVIAKKDSLVKKEQTVKIAAMGAGLDKASSTFSDKVTPPQRRSVPMATRRYIWQAAGRCCEFTDSKSGRRCNSRHQLEIEHDQPRAFGGGNELENLKLYCRAHNVLAARDATLM